MVGGAPVTAEFASSIGADIYADNVIEAVELVKKGVWGLNVFCRRTTQSGKFDRKTLRKQGTQGT